MIRAAGRAGPSLVVAAMLALGLAAQLNMARDIGRPFTGVLVYRNHLRNTWQVEPSTPPWWPALAQSRLRYGDALVSIDGVPYRSAAREQLAEAVAAGRDRVRATVRRLGHDQDVDLPIERFTFGHFMDVAAPEFINGLAVWLLAVAVLRSRPGELVNRVFATAFALLAGSLWATMPSAFFEAGVVTRGLHLAWAAAFCGMGAPFIHLALLVPEPARHRPRLFVGALYAYTVAITAVYAAGLLLFWRDPASSLAIATTNAANGLHHLVLLAGCALCGGRLLRLRSRRHALSRRVGRQVAVLSLGLVLCLPYVAMKVLRTYGGHGTHFWAGLDLRGALLALPISVAFLILRYQTFRRAHAAIGGILILGSSALLAGFGAWLMRLLDPRWTSAIPTPFLPLFAVAGVAGLLWSTETSWRESVARLFDWHRRSYVAARQFGHDVVGQHDLRRTPSAIAAALVGRMELERAALWLWDETARIFTLAAQEGQWSRPPAASLALPVLPPPAPPLRLRGASLPNWAMPLRAQEGVEVVAVLWASGRPVGLLGLGKRWDDDIFDERDLEIVELIAQQCALFLLTAAQVDQLRGVPHRIAQTQERERFRIAQELHDTVQQFLGRLPFYLEVSRSAARDDPAQTETILARCLTDVEAAAQAVREIRANLAPLQLEQSLHLPLQHLVRHFASRTGIPAQGAISPEVDACLGREARHALYRVVQQALDNVQAHAAAASVTVSVGREADRVVLTIGDDGHGFSEEDRARAAERGRFGLTSMQARITGVGGELRVDSRQGAGTTVSAWVPVESPRADTAAPAPT